MKRNRGSEFCRNHAKHSHCLKYGRFDNHLADDKLEKLLIDAAKEEKETGFKYYCRATMWHKASELKPDINNLDELDD